MRGKKGGKREEREVEKMLDWRAVKLFICQLFASGPRDEGRESTFGDNDADGERRRQRRPGPDVRARRLHLQGED